MTSDLANTIVGLERQRLLALVGRRVEELDALHAPDFELIHPSGGVWSRGEYLGGIASGEIDYRRFEATSSMEVLGDNDVAVVRYRSLIDIAVRGQPVGLLACWHLDCYRRAGGGDPWRVRWSQATEIGA